MATAGGCGKTDPSRLPDHREASAYHEAGHAVAAVAVYGFDAVA